MKGRGQLQSGACCVADGGVEFEQVEKSANLFAFAGLFLSAPPCPSVVLPLFLLHLPPLCLSIL